MRTWSYGGNPLPQFLYGSVTLVEMPWWLWLTEQFTDRSCGWIPEIPFPNWPKLHFDKDHPEYTYSPKTWYGDLSQFYHVCVCLPMFEWIWKHPKRKEYHFEVGWTKLKEVMQTENPKYFGMMEESR